MWLLLSLCGLPMQVLSREGKLLARLPLPGVNIEALSFDRRGNLFVASYNAVKSFSVYAPLPAADILTLQHDAEAKSEPDRDAKAADTPASAPAIAPPTPTPGAMQPPFALPPELLKILTDRGAGFVPLGFGIPPSSGVPFQIQQEMMRSLSVLSAPPPTPAKQFTLELLTTFGTKGKGPLEFTAAKGVAFGADGRIFTAEGTYGGRVQALCFAFD